MISTAPTEPKPVLAIDATESVVGRALLAISSLYFAESWLHGVQLRFTGAPDANVQIAIGALRSDLGVEAAFHADVDSALANADLFAAIAFQNAAHLPLKAVHWYRMKAVIAIQYPDPEWADLVAGQDPVLAFDPRRFAQCLEATLAQRTGHK
ncbi:MAG: hypothetical protein R2831_13485 [Chitinophagaceae bacterium]